MKLTKTPNVHSVSCGNGNMVCYNTLLNLPILLDEDSYNYFTNLEEIDLQNGEYSKEEKELMGALRDSYLLLEEGDNEDLICRRINNTYLNRLAAGQTIHFLDLRISEKCNFGCKHCISSSAQSNEVMTGEVATDIVDHVVLFLSEKNHNFSHIDLHYGNAEPLMNFAVIKNVQEHFRKHYPHISKTASINTNLSLLTEEIADFLIKEDIAVYASLDGTKDANDSIRIFKSGKGTFDVIWKKIELLRKKGNGLGGISVTLTDKNFPYFDLSFIDWCVENGFKSLAMDFDLVNPLGISIDERADFLTSMWKKCNELNIEFFGTWITPFLNISNRSITDKHYAFCKGVQGKSLSVAPNGLVYLCGSSSMSLGHYKGIGSSLKSGGLIYNMVSSRLIGENKMCKGCIIEGSCAGQCQVTNEHSAGNKKELCDYYRTVTERLLSIQGASDLVS